MQLVTLMWTLLRSFVTALTQASTLPARAGHSGEEKSGASPERDRLVESDTLDGLELDGSINSFRNDGKQPILAMGAWSCVATLLRLHDRMPWLTGLLSLMQWLLLAGPGQLCCTDSILDR